MRKLWYCGLAPGVAYTLQLTEWNERVFKNKEALTITCP